MLKNISMKLLIALLLLISSSTSLLANTYNFTGLNANETNVGSQLSLDVTQAGNLVDFKFINAAGGTDVFIGAIYFDFQNANLFSNLNQTGQSGIVSFTGVTPSVQNFPEGNAINFTTNAEGDRNKSAANGVNIGEFLILTATLNPVADINALLSNGGLRVGLHMQGFANGGSDSYVNAVPLPAAGWLFGSALIGLAGLRRKSL